MRIGSRAALWGGALVAFVALQACNNSGSSPVGPGGNTPPVVSSVSADPTRVTPGGSTLVMVSAVDADGDTFECSWNSSTGGSFTSQSSDRCRTQWRAPSQGGVTRLDVTVRDRRGASTSSSVDVTVEAPSSASGPQPSPTPTPEPPGPGPAPGPTPTPGPTPAPSPSPTPSPNPTPSPGVQPLIARFTADPSSISNGQTATLSWATENTTSVTIDRGIGGVALSGTVQVNPTATTVYTLTASGAAGSVSGTTTVVVGQPSCTPPTVAGISGGGTCHPRPGQPCSVQFSANASGTAPLTYSWSGCCSGSSTSSACSIGAPGNVACTLSVSNACGSASSQAQAAGTNQVPTVSASGGGSCHPRPGQPCTTNVSGSGSDPDGDAVTLSWSGCASGTGGAATCSVSQPGTNTATLTASDVWEASKSANVTSTGTNAAPSVSFNPTSASGAAAASVASWGNSDGDTLTCTWSYPMSACGFGPSGCSLGGSANGSKQCQYKVGFGQPSGTVCQFTLECSDGWTSASATFSLSYFAP